MKTPAAVRLPRPPEETRRIIAALHEQHPNANTELRFENAYQLLVATILSAQCTDERVNKVTPAAFRRYPDPAALAKATPATVERLIKSTGFFRAKSRALIGMARALVERHHGEVPPRMEDLVQLPGVGRKTANVVLGHALGVPGLAVDRHVLRVANRIGIADSDDPEVVEQQLCAALPPSQWTAASDVLILHGRRICKPRPLCEKCVVRDDCAFYQSGQADAQRAAGRPPASRAARAKPAAARAGAKVAARKGATAGAKAVRASTRHSTRATRGRRRS